MIELLLIILPLLFAGIILLVKRNAKELLFTAGLLHFAGIVLLFCGFNRPFLPEYFAADNAGRIVAGIASMLFITAAYHLQCWIPLAARFESKHGIPMQEKYFCSLLLAFLAMMTAVAFSRNLGILWVAVEATTLFSAPLIIYHRSATSLEAMWKYLLICSVGIALALFGTYLLFIAYQTGSTPAPGLNLGKLAALSGKAHPAWFKAAFLFCFAGYGLKMGLAPFHTWLPDAHGESPSAVSLLLSGALLNCSALGIIRIVGIAPETLLPFCREILLAFGLLSLLVAALFIIGQKDYKRMLAYSSVEHMGLLAIFLGLNAPVLLFLHMTFHSLCKMLLFLGAGNYLLAYGTRRIAAIRGTGKLLPRTAFVWFAGILMICGMPPSPLFITEIGLAAIAGPWLGGIILILLFAVFAGMTHAAMKMTAGTPDNPPALEAGSAAEKLSRTPLFGMILIMLTGGIMLGVMLLGGGVK